MAGGATRLTDVMTRIPRWSRLAVLILASVAVVACGSSGTPSDSAVPSDTTAGASPSGTPAPDGCTYMTIAQATEALGAQIDTATPLTDAVGCTYEITGSSTLIGFQFADEAYWNEAKAGDHTAIDVGDEAFYVTDAGFTTLAVRKGSTYFSVVVNIPSGSAKSAVDVGTSVANHVLAGLP